MPSVVSSQLAVEDRVFLFAPERFIIFLLSHNSKSNIWSYSKSNNYSVLKCRLFVISFGTQKYDFNWTSKIREIYQKNFGNHIGIRIFPRQHYQKFALFQHRRRRKCGFQHQNSKLIRLQLLHFDSDHQCTQIPNLLHGQ